MAKYTDLLNQLVEDGTLTQEQHDELADLSVAKEAIKEFNTVKSERDELAAFKAKIDTAPKRAEALKRVGVDYDAQKQYGRDALDALPADKLDDLDFVASFVKEKGFEATISTEAASGEQSGAEQITSALTNMGTGEPVRTDKNAEFEAARDGAKTKEELRAVLAAHGQLDEN